MRKSNAGIALVAVALLFSAVHTLEAGKLRRLLYNNYSGSWITNLYTTNDFGFVTFPNQPDGADFLPSPDPAWGLLPPYNAQTVVHTGTPDKYGSWIEGYLMAPETGQYTFWLASDDEGQFYMTTDPANPLDPAKTNLLCWVPGYSGSAQWDKFPQQQSAPVTLEQGKTYYIEIFHKEGTGGDHIEIGWQTPSGLLQRPMPAWHFQPIKFSNPWAVEPDAEVVMGQVIPNATTPFNIFDGNLAVVYVNVNLAMPVTYQWLKNGTPMTGETNAYYLFRANTADNNTVYSVKVTSGGTVYSAAGPALFVMSDKPTVISAGMVPQNPTMVQVVFSEDVNPLSATNASNYSISGGVTVQAATVAADSRTVSLKTTLMQPTQVYTLSVSGVQDMATPPNTMDPASATFIIAEGSINFRVYNNSFATDLASLRTATTNSTTPNAIYINNLFDSDALITYMSPAWNLTPLRNYYVGQIIGYVTPPVTGQYKFAIASDDHSILYLGFTDQRSSKREICNYNGATGRWNLGAQLANQQSALITLQAGQRYYLEAVYRDATGGDGVTVCWQTPTDVANGTLMPTNNASTQSATEPFLIPARYLSPFTAFGNIFFRTNLPATLTAAGGTAPVFKVTVDGTLPYYYQWLRDGTAIPGATGSAYTLPYLQATDSGASFSVTVSNNFSSATSVVAVVTVTADTTKPTVASVGSLFSQTIELRFSEPVAAAVAGDKANYLLFSSADVPVAVNGVVLDGSDATHVTLQTATMPETDLMKLVVQNVTDLSANVINSATNLFRANNFEAAVPINNNQAWSATAVGERLLLTSGGNDIWGTADGCLFLYKTVTGNFDYKVQGVSLPAVNSWCKMGPMGRESTAAGSRNVFNPFTPVTPGQNTYSAQTRDTTGGGSQSSNDASTQLNANVQPGVPARPTINPYPSWTRIQRIGNSFYYYYSADGTNWTYWTFYDSSASTAGALPTSFLFGVALTSHDTSRTVDGILNQFIAVNDGSLRFASTPTNTTCIEGNDAIFTAVFAGGSPFSYQWLTNGVPVNATPTTSVGANQTLTLTRVPYAWDGLKVACRITNPYGETATSPDAILTVIKDTVAPTVRYYVTPKINITSTQVKLLYSERVNKASAETLSSYVITSLGGAPLAISSAVLDTDERTVILTTVAQTPGTTYKVVVNNVIDQACCPPNAIPANSTDYYYYAGSSGNFAQRSDGYIIMEAENAQLNQAGTSGGAVPFSVLTTSAGYSGAAYMAVPYGLGSGGSAGTAPNLYGTGAKLTFNIVFNRVGRHIVWIRGWNMNLADPGSNDSVFVGFSEDNVNDWLVSMNATADNSTDSGWSGNWSWRSDRYSGTDPLTFTNTTTGLHRFIIWERESGTLVDKIVIEAGNRAAGNTAAPAPATANGGLGDPETWDFISAPPGAPTISIINPTNTQAFAAGSNIPVEASVPAPPSPIALVEFFNGTNLIGTATSAPYTMTWGSVPEGIYSVTARVTDVLGYQATSAAVQFVVDSTKPVAYAVGSLGGTGIGVYFSDLTGLDPISANNPTNYLVNGGAVNVTNAALEVDNLAVMLSLDAPVSGSFSVQITNVADRGFGPNVMQPTTLSSTVITWALNQDVGTTNTSGVFTDPAMAGFAQAIGTDGIYVHAGGHDIWDAADGLHFVYLPVTGDFDVSTRVAALLRPDQWSKAGIMIREELTGDSRNLHIAATPTTGVNVVTMQWRPVKGSATVGIASNLRPTPSPIPNAWLRVTGTNNLYTFMWGTNGADWTTLYTTNMSATPYSKVYLGLATTSHNNGTNLSNVTASYYRNVSGLAPAVMAAPMLSVDFQNSTLTLTWPADRIGMRLENQFHSPGGGIDNNWSTVPGSATTNKVVIPIELNQGSMFFRLAYP